MKKVKHLGNFWIDLVPEIKLPILDKAVEYGYLKKEFVEEMKGLETDKNQKRKGKHAITK